MADLDDFFAKKDRKKSKGKKFTTTEEIAKKLEESGKKLEKTTKKEKPVNPEGGEETPQIEDEDEWKVFEEEKKDYTGLKIGNLTLNETLGADSDDERGTGENSSDGECGEGGSKHSGPWKKPELPPQSEPIVVVEAPPPPPPAVAAAAAAAASAAAAAGPGSGIGGSSYKPPHLRNVQTISPSPRTRGRNVAPDIHSEEYFPTLSANKQANESSGAWGKRRRDEGTFEEVRNRGGSRSSYSLQDAQSQAPKLSLGNKYGALSQDQS